MSSPFILRIMGMNREMELEAAQAKKRRGQALKMHEAGLTLQEIGVQLGITRQRVHQMVDRARRDKNGQKP